MYENRIEKILVLDELNQLSGLVTMKDIEKSAEHPDATKDSSGRLRVGAALGTGADTIDRAKALQEAGVDVFVVDSAHGHSKNVLDIVKLIKKEFKDIEVIGGNVATPEGALELVKINPDITNSDMEEIAKYSQSWYNYFNTAQYYENSMFYRDTCTLLYFNYKTTHTFVYKKKRMADGTFKVVEKDDQFNPPVEM